VCARSAARPFVCSSHPPRHPPPPLRRQLGTYNPLPYELDGAKEVRLVVDRVKYWLSVGAQPSDRVAYLLWRAGLGPAPPVRLAPKQSKPKEKKGFHSASLAWTPSAPSLGAAFRTTQPARVAFHGFFSRVVEMR
jgi:ribosomal protein S16